MSVRTAHRTARPQARPVRRRPGQSLRGRRMRRRRWLAGLVVAVAAVGTVAFVTGLGPLGDAVRELTLPLRHDDIIRQQARDKNVDAALIAAVIYEESRFRDQTSQAGARGLMQITPDTADFIAKHSGGYRFEQSDLATPQINIAYGTYYLRLLLDHYDGEEEPAIAAYNAGLTNADRWVAEAGGAEDFDAEGNIPFPETRAYVANVLERRDQYRDRYAAELGL